jgi:hypothetical protein
MQLFFSFKKLCEFFFGFITSVFAFADDVLNFL